ncbi:hypothetical protein C8J56DRAFT_1042267 [Mycena floridula]|nr:hypothetical protein C8J56DRAFT_1042267 [Mycena floridula]
MPTIHVHVNTAAPMSPALPVPSGTLTDFHELNSVKADSKPRTMVVDLESESVTGFGTSKSPILADEPATNPYRSVGDFLAVMERAGYFSDHEASMLWVYADTTHTEFRITHANQVAILEPAMYVKVISMTATITDVFVKMALERVRYTKGKGKQA